MKISRLFYFIFCIALLFAFCGCSAPKPPSFSAGEEQTGTDEVSAAEPVLASDVAPELTNYTVAIIDAAGNEQQFSFSSGSSSLYSALMEQSFIEGRDSAAGFVVLLVNGIGSDYEDCGIAWELLVNGEISPLSIDRMELEDGAVYTFIAQ